MPPPDMHLPMRITLMMLAAWWMSFLLHDEYAHLPGRSLPVALETTLTRRDHPHTNFSVSHATYYIVTGRRTDLIRQLSRNHWALM